jgi:DNA polymerase III epsilon subunit-like protein
MMTGNLQHVANEQELHVMLDLETLSSEPDATIISIGAVAFETASGISAIGGDTQFYEAVDPSSSRGHLDARTMQWWAKQSDQARAVLNAPARSQDRVLLSFAEFVFEAAAGRPVNIWGNGADFDNVVLRNAFKREALEAPWSYRGNRCYRTLKSLAPHIAFDNPGVAHNALDDARAQADHAIRIFAWLKSREAK